MQTKGQDAFTQLSDIENPRNIAQTIFSHYNPTNSGSLTKGQLAQMMRDTYKNIDGAFQPSEKDLESYMKLMDRNKDGQVTLPDVE